MPHTRARLVIGIDVGGTFVDCAVVRSGRLLGAAKSPTTPADPLDGVLGAIDAAASTVGLAPDELLAGASAIRHGTTIGLNTLLSGTGACVGLLATRGHEDAILIGRVHQKVAGLGADELIRVAELNKPAPIVPRWRIHGIHERLDAAGAEVAPLDESGVAAAAQALQAEGCDAIAISFLWAFRDPSHERRAAGIVREVMPGVPISLSSDVAPVMGEYERTAATVVNAYLARTQATYIQRLAEALAARGFAGELGMLLSTGGIVPAAAVAHRPVETLRSGPVGGVIAAARLGGDIGALDLVATDVGGTSFDVGVIVGGRPAVSDVSLAGRLHLAVPSVDIASIGAGGGSVAWVDADGGLHVGPRSMGADPGPACYGRGGDEATLTDADLVLGRLDPQIRLGGQLELDRAAGERAVGRIAKRLGIGLREAAAGIVRVADARMADLIRRVTIERGHDPRKLTLVAYGGAGALHAAAYGFDAGAREVVVPRGGSTLSALGLGLAEYSRSYRRSVAAVAPLDPAASAAIFSELERKAEADVDAAGDAGGDLVVRREIDFRYRRQTHQLGIELTAGSLDAMALGAVVERFEAEYERVYGPGTGYRAAGIEAVTFRLVASVPAPAAESAPDRAATPNERSPVATTRAVWFGEGEVATAVLDGETLGPGDRIDGPAIVDWTMTSIVVHPGQHATIDAFGHVHIRRTDG